MKKSDARFQRVVEGFPAYPHSASLTLDRWLQNLTCRVHAARWFECFPTWEMHVRRLPHDLLFYVLEGKGEAWVGGERSVLRKGICLYCPRGLEHAARQDPRHPLHVLVLHYTALVDFSLTLSDFLTFPCHFDIKADPMAEELLREICRQTVLTPAAWQNSVDASLLVFLFRLIHRHGEKIRSANSQRLSDLARLIPVIRHMRESLSSSHSVGEYAASAHLSAPQFRRVFHRATGQSPNQFLRALRMQKAAIFLRGTHQTIETIAGLVGYQEPAFFSKTFKAVMGLPPGAYRKQIDVLV